MSDFYLYLAEALDEREKYERVDAVEHLVWLMFEEFDTVTIYHQLALLAEQEDITGDDIRHAWQVFDELRRNTREPITKEDT
jgi:hypothetical protein